MVPGADLLSVEEARERLLELLDPTGSEFVGLSAGAGRVLAKPLRALDAAPPFDVSEMDGYAVRAADTAGASESGPVHLAASFAVHAGEVAPAPLAERTTCWIATGAPLPDGADAVVPREWTDADDRLADRDRRVIEFRRAAAAPGSFVRRRGADFEAGDEILGQGTLLSPGALALAASAGATALEVRLRPRVAILAVGDELLEPGQPLRPGAIRESNRLMISGLVRGAGGVPEDLGIVRDDACALDAALVEAFRRDVVVVTGGASVGERDLVRGALDRLGAPPQLWRVALKPGKPFAFATRERSGCGRSAVFALPGNPASSLVTFHLFVGPAIRSMCGRKDACPVAMPALLTAPAEAAPDRRTYLRSRLEWAKGMPAVRPLARQAAGSVRSVGEADALVVLRPGERVGAGETVSVEPIAWWR